MSGTEKLPLLIIGNSANPRAFKGKEIPLSYKANRKTWMTAEIFEDWLKYWDRRLKRVRRKVLLYLDNFSGHSNIKLENITIKFLPPNTTARSPPCDQGIIQSLKVHYLRFLLRDRIAAIDDKAEYEMNLYKALQYLRKSWNDVKPDTLANCFRKAGFVKPLEPVEEEPAQRNINDELNSLWAEMQALKLVEGTMNDYLTVDDQLAIGGMLTLAEIAEDISTAEVEEPESDNEVTEINEEPVLPTVTSREAKEAVQVLLRYSSNPKILQLCDAADNVLAEELLQRLKQKNHKLF